MEPTPDSQTEPERPDPQTRRLARELDEYVEANFGSQQVPKHVRLLLAERLTRITGTLDDHGATVNVMLPVQAVRQLLLEGLVTGYMLSRLEQRFFLQRNLDPDGGDDETIRENETPPGA